MVDSSVLAGIQVGVTVFALTTIFAFIKNKFKCIDKIDQRTIRQSKAQLAAARQIDYLHLAEHGDSKVKSNLYTETHNLLTDENGDL